jgi:hypothetical protein
MISQKLIIISLVMGILLLNKQVAHCSMGDLDYNYNTIEQQYENIPLQLIRQSKLANYLESMRKKSVLRNGPSFPFRIGKRVFMKNSD